MRSLGVIYGFLQLGMGVKFKDKIMLQGCREEYCKYGPVTGMLYWVSDILGELVRHV